MKKVLITGCAGGIGQATARYFADNHYTVLLHYNSSEAGAVQLSQELIAKGADVHLYQADLSCQEQLDRMMTDIIARHKRLDVLVNNAGVSLCSMLQDTSTQQYDYCFAVNCKASYFVTKYVVNNMLKFGSGSIVMIGSIWGLEGASCESVYSMTKHAVVGLAKSLAMELDGSGICVNCLCPSIVLTSMNSHLSQCDIEEFGRQHNCTAVDVDNVARSIYYLATSGQSGIVAERYGEE